MPKPNPQSAAVNDADSRLVWIEPEKIEPSPENGDLYLHDEAGIKNLAKSIERDGILDPLVITSDYWIVSGHRRREAAMRLVLSKVPCRVLPFRKSDLSKENYVRLLREFNRQRSKTIADIIREATVDANPGAAHARLVAHRAKRATAHGGEFKIEGVKKRFEISEAKQPMLAAALSVVNSLRDFWPLTVRQVHYCLVSNPPLRNAGRPDSGYKNDRASYQDLCDILVRARLSGELRWDRIKDETRPVRLWQTFRQVGEYVTSDLSGLFAGYFRDLMQSQPDHIEIIVEKNTSLSVVEQVAMRYCIPTTSGRGYSSKEPLFRMAQRFEQSGKNRLVLLLLSDFDPDGDQISNSTAKSLRDDFGIYERKIVPVRVAVRPDQVQKFNLPKSLEAKSTSSNYGRFVEKHGVTYAVELEAMQPAELQSELDAAIRAHIDVKLYNAELEHEKQEAAKLESLKKRALKFITEGAE